MGRFGIVFAVAVFCSGAALAAVDYKCQTNCLNAGYQYGYCKSICSYGQEPSIPMPQPVVLPPATRTDYKCMNDCAAAGYMYAYCKSRCEY